MSGFLIFLAVALWFGVKVRKAYQKQMSELESGAASDEGTVKSTFESLFNESPDKTESEPATSSFASEAANAGYYSYEAPASTGRRATEAPKWTAHKAKVAVDPVQIEQEPVAFDLRQAVIYQTILTNKYLTDVHSYEIN